MRAVAMPAVALVLLVALAPYAHACGSASEDTGTFVQKSWSNVYVNASYSARVLLLTPGEMGSALYGSIRCAYQSFYPGLDPVPAVYCVASGADGALDAAGKLLDEAFVPEQMVYAQMEHTFGYTYGAPCWLHPDDLPTPP